MKNKFILAAYIAGAVLFLLFVGASAMVLSLFLISREPTLSYLASPFFLCGQAMVMFTGIMVIIIISIKKKRLSEIFSFKKISKKYICTSLFIGFLFGLASVAGKIKLLADLFLYNKNYFKLMLSDEDFLKALYNIFILILINGILTILCIFLKEILFRGWLFNKIQNLSNVQIAIGVTTILTAVIFPYGFGIVLALILSLIYYKTKSIWPPFIIGVVTTVFNSINIEEKISFNPLPTQSMEDIISIFVYGELAEEIQKSFFEKLLIYIQYNIISIISLTIVSIPIIWYLLRMKEVINSDE